MGTENFEPPIETLKGNEKMVIEKVTNIEEAIKCNKLLTKLINTESLFDENIDGNYIINNYFENIYEQENSSLFIAKKDNDDVIGYAYCKITTTENEPYINHVALLDGLYVEEEHRKQGIATKLIEECKLWASKKGAKFFELNVISKNANALNLYKRMGFNEVQKKMRLKIC